jgi:prepilin-type N-terminal cleavage/methylation domain-containing protein/prepilin-type processing-associated H-X9-DG protein
VKQRFGNDAFTLVELLVVIGIIALLVGILLPALSAARRQAAAAKCAASLREIGNAFQMYSLENKGFAPPARLFGSTGNIYEVGGTSFYDGSGKPNSTPNPAYWFNFLSKYVTKNKVGYAANNGSDAAQGTQSIFWACPAWQSYNNATIGGTNVTQTGYGMNGFPEYTARFPIKGLELGESSGTIQGVNLDELVGTPRYTGPGWSNFANRWYKLRQWTQPAERALAGDCIFWFMESRPALTPPQMAGQYMLLNQQTWATTDGAHETTIDWYRHGRYPGTKPGTTDEFDPNGGKVAFNILFADGHVATLNDQSASYRTVRMRYPG